MTSSAAVRALTPRAKPSNGATIDLAAWSAWLDDQLDPDWRPGEWDAERLLFNGNPDNPRTAVWRCLRCGMLTAKGSGLCTLCGRVKKQSGLSREEFLRTCPPEDTRNRRFGSHELCAVADGDLRCLRKSWCRGLCRNHYQAFRRNERSGRSFEQWIVRAKPLAALDKCRVRGCIIEPFGRRRLCPTHYKEFRRAVASGSFCDNAGDLAHWVDQVAMPFMLAHQFSLNRCTPLVRSEVLFALQERDRSGDSKIDPEAMRGALKRAAGVGHLVGNTAFWQANTRGGIRGIKTGLVFLRDIKLRLDAAVPRFRGVDPKTQLTWHLSALDIPSTHTLSGKRVLAGTIDFAEITQPWLRDLVQQWARSTNPDTTVLRQYFGSCCRASTVLRCRPGGDDVTQLGFADINAVVDSFRVALGDKGQQLTNKYRRTLLSRFFEILDFGRDTGRLDAMPVGFARHRTHHIAVVEVSEDEFGKAIPESVIRQLDDHLHMLGEEPGIRYGDLSREDAQMMFQAVYRVHRDTGRRPRETCSLQLGCLEYLDGEYNLIWDNQKGKRLHRRLPIVESTAKTIIEWRERRSRLVLPARARNYLFPAATNDALDGYLRPARFGEVLNERVDGIPELHSEALDSDGNRLPFDRNLIYPYAFRHSFAQRYADAGVRVEVLKDIMDHVQVSTTMGYFKVTLARKREAVETIRHHVLDRAGQPAKAGSPVSYQAKSIAVPFGNCHEPSNVKAGGKACPIRFQCAGCGFYRPDPSYLPAVEEHVRSLKTDRETADAIGVDEFVVRNLTDQITAFQEVVKTIREHMDQLPADERRSVEEAAAVLRRARAADGIPSPTERRLTLPLTVIEKGQRR